MKHYKLSFQQEEMWLAEQFYSQGSLFVIGGYLQLGEDIDINLYSDAVQMELNARQSYRARISVDEDGLPYQVFEHSKKFKKRMVLDLDSEEAALKWMDKQMNIAMFCDADSLVEFAVLQAGEDKYFFLKVHHILSDYWGINILLADIFSRYEMLLRKEKVEPTCYKYSDYIDAQLEYLDSLSYKKDKLYWESAIDNVNKYKNIFSVDNECSSPSKIISFEVDNLKKKMIDSYAKNNNVSSFVVWSYIVGEILRQETDNDNYTIGAHFLNRTNSKQKHTAGLFVNTLPIKIDKDKGLHGVSESIKNAFRHQRFPMRKIPETDNLYEVVVSYRSYNNQKKIFGEVYPFPLKSKESSYPIEVYVTDQNEFFNIEFVCQRYVNDKYVADIIAKIRQLINKLAV